MSNYLTPNPDWMKQVIYMRAVYMPLLQRNVKKWNRQKKALTELRYFGPFVWIVCVLSWPTVATEALLDFNCKKDRNGK